MLQLSSNTLQQVEKFKYLGVVFTSDGRRSEEIDIRVGKANEVLREFHGLCGHKTRAFNTTKLSVFKSVFVPILTCGHESWVMTERKLTQVQAPDMGFLRRVHSVTQGCTEDRWRPGQEINLAPPRPNLRSFGNECIALKKKLAKLLGVFGVLSGSAPGHCVSLSPSSHAWSDTWQQSARLRKPQNPERRNTSPN